MPARKSLDKEDAAALHTSQARQMVLSRLYGRTPLPELIGLDTSLDLVHSLLDRTVSSAEGNTALLIGPRGSGKSSIVQKSLDMLHAKHKTGDSSGYHVVRLSGFVHTSDRIALRDIARQLLIEQDLEDVLIGSFADAFTYILNLLRVAGAEGSMAPVLFILEEFDLLAQHPKQSLLYTLFDIAQSQQTPIAVLGVTARIDVMDLLEKRVKSRFSHRQIHVQNSQSLEDFTSIARSSLHIGSRGDAGEAPGTNSSIPADFTAEFNNQVDALLQEHSVARYIAEVYELGKDARQLLRTFVLATSRLSANEPFLLLEHVHTSIARERASAKLQVLGSISLLELCLIISMKSLVQGGSSKYNFEMVYNEYKTFMSRHMMAVAAGGAMKVYKKSIALKAFETLVELEIVRPAAISVSSAAAESGGGAASANGRNDLLAGSAQSARAPKEYRMVQLMLEPGQVVELLADRTDVPAVIRRWAQQ
ncbi:origin recognition complex, subunit 4 [Martensiomyces pterosporus]|nr:origin recognition complex, subunit 4 [Martensiomyces pterosporus]